MNVIDKIVNWWNPEKGMARARARIMSEKIKAGYDGAGKGRRTSHMVTNNNSQNRENRSALSTLRARSREAVRNNPYASKAIASIVANTVGAGIIPAVRGSNKRTLKNVQDALNAWSWSTDCDHAGRLDFYGIQSLVMRSVAEAGEVLILREYVNDPRMPVGLKLHVLEIDHLDTLKDGNLEDGGRIIQGIEFDSAGRRRGYWLFKDHPGDLNMRSFSSEFVSADQVIHVFDMVRPGQARGVPFGTAGMMRLSILDDYQDARVEQQKVAACLVGAIIDDQNDQEDGDVLPEKLEPGMLPRLAFGQDIKFNSPPSTTGHGDFVSTELRAVAAAYGITYEMLTGDYTRTNFSSGRMGWIEASRNIDRWRWCMLIPLLCKGVEKWFLEAAGFNGYDVRNVSFEWTPPRREMIDPTKETKALVEAVQGKIKSWSETVRESGYDPDQVAEEMKADMERFAAMNISLFDTAIQESKDDDEEDKEQSAGEDKLDG